MDNAVSLAREVLMQDMEVDVVSGQLWPRPDFRNYAHEECLICYGEIDFVREFQRQVASIPGAWCNFGNMKCSVYYAYLGEYLLNKSYAMMPVGDLLRRWEELTGLVNGKSLFIRPESGAKPFTGYVVSPGEKHKITALVESVGPDLLVVVSPEKKISTEWRFVVCDKMVVAGCQYLPNISPGWSTPSFRLAEQIASQEWQPDLCYTVDIAESEGEVYLLEINSFSCAGFYDCNLRSIVRCASETAKEEWLDYNE